MKKHLKNRTLAIISLFVLIYILSILIEKRITPNNSFDFKLWSPYYLIFTLIIPILILLPVKYFPASKYSKFIIKRERTIKKVIIGVTIFLVLWFLAWYGMKGFGKLIDKSLKISEASKTAISFVKSDSTIYHKTGGIKSIKSSSYDITAKTANYNYIVYGKDTTLRVKVLLSHKQKWIVDTLMIK